MRRFLPCRALPVWLLLLASAAAAPGCGGPGVPATTVVEPDSAAYKKALAETEEMIRELKAAEAKAQQRLRGPLPSDD
jgi:hypothetical protein